MRGEPSYLGKLRDIVGRERVLTELEDQLVYSRDATPFFRQRPTAVVLPRSVEEIAAVLRLANEARFGVIPRGSGTGLSAGAVPTENAILLLMTGLNRVLELDTENMTLTAEPGVITAHVHQRVEAQGLFYPPDPGSMNVCTIGGNVAENSGGLRGLKYGVTRQYVMGVEAVLPCGEVVQTGTKCIKDVAGYHLTDLLVGSEGTLGIITRVLLRLIPKPAAARTLLVLYDRLVDAGRSVSEIIAARVIPCTLEFLDQVTVQCVEAYAQIGLPTDLAALLLIEVDGHPAAVEDDARKVAEICRRCGAREVRVATSAQEALELKTARRTAFAALARRRPTTLLEDATVPRSEVATMIERCRCIAEEEGVEMGNFGHAGDGNLHPTVLTDERDAAAVARAHRFFARVFDTALSLGGTVTGEHGIGLAKKDFLERRVGSAGLNLMRQVRAVLDPNGILNPGKVLDYGIGCEGHLPVNVSQIPASPWSPTRVLANDGFPVAGG